MPNESNDDKLSLRQIISSVLAAAFGVQSGNNLKRDFSKGRVSHFIIVGIGFTALFIWGIIILVDWIL